MAIKVRFVVHCWPIFLSVLGIVFCCHWALIGNPLEIRNKLSRKEYIYELTPNIFLKPQTRNVIIEKPDVILEENGKEHNKEKEESSKISPFTEKPTEQITIFPTKIKKDLTKRIINRKEEESISVESVTTEKFKEKINCVVYDPLGYDKPPILDVSYDKEGFLDTQRNRINFKKSDWYAQFQYYRELLANQPLNDNKFQSFVKTSNAETDAILDENYGILSNTCLDASNLCINLYGEKGMNLQKKITDQFKIRDFYFSTACAVEGTVPSEKFHINDNHTAVFRPRSYSNIYHFLEGTSQLIRLALHPHQFPPISHVVISSQKTSNFQKWHGFMEYVYLDLFAQSKRPVIHFTKGDSIIKNKQAYCDPLMVIFRNWDSNGAGNFIPDLLGVDMVRAAAYRHAGVVINLQKKEKLYYMQVSRVNKRRLLNEVELYSSIMLKYGDRLDGHFAILENESASMQVQRFAQVDLLVAAHGAGLTNVIFMIPDSFLIELMPPFWDLACYKRLSENASIGYKMIRAVGKKGKECDKNPYSQLCRRKGIRDRDFNISETILIGVIDQGIRHVEKFKYV